MTAKKIFERRDVLGLLSGTAVTANAGCLTDSDDSDDETDDTPSDTEEIEDDTDDDATDSIDPVDPDHLVGAHYYPWYGIPGGAYERWTDESPSEPLLGEYDATDREVIEQHVQWCLEHGIRWLSCSWWGENRQEDEVMREHLPEADGFEHLTFSITYETLGRFDGDHPFDADEDAVRNRFQQDLQYLNDTFFERDNYHTIDGRPVLYIYAAGTLVGDVVSMYEEVTESVGVDPYLIVDVTDWDRAASISASKIADAVTVYNPSEDRDDIDDVFHDLYEEGLETLHLATEYTDVDFFPPITPGYDDTEIVHDGRDSSSVLPPSPERYERGCQQLKPHLKHMQGALITSFNEWFEDTQIEPTDEYGTEYLELTRELLATGEPEAFELEGIIVELVWGETVQAFERSSASETDTRHISLMCYELTVLDADGDVIASYDIGEPDDELKFVVGVHDPEASNDETSRWLGGDFGKTVFRIGVDDIAAIELDGLPVKDMDVEITIGDRSGSAELRGDERDQYHLEL